VGHPPKGWLTGGMGLACNKTHASGSNFLSPGPRLNIIKVSRLRQFFIGTQIFMIIKITYDLSAKIISIIKICVANKH
jgi:hypothetical protein